MSSQTPDKRELETLIALRISSAKRDAFRELAKANQRTVSAEIRWMIDERLANAA